MEKGDHRRVTSLTSDCMEKLPCITEECTIQEDEEWSGQSRMILKGYINNDDILNGPGSQPK